MSEQKGPQKAEQQARPVKRPRMGAALAAAMPAASTVLDDQKSVMALQDAAGNQAVNRWLSREAHDSTGGPVNGHPASTMAGRPLDPAVRTLMEARFRHSFGQVAIHTGEAAARKADSHNAHAVTERNHIYFGQNAYAPHTPTGRAILAHELTHVIQTRQQGRAPRATEAGLEAEATLASARVSAGQTAEVQLGAASKPLALSRKEKIAIGVVAGLAAGLLLAGGIIGIAALAGAALGGGAAAGLLIGLGVAGGIAGGFVGNRLAKKAQLVRDPHLVAKEATETLQTIARSIKSLTELAGDKPAADAHKLLNQQRLQTLLVSARTTYNHSLQALPPNDPLRAGLRNAYLDVLGELRSASEAALAVASSLEQPAQNAEKRQYAETLTLLAESSPMTSTGLAGTTEFGEADVKTGNKYEAYLEAYLDDLLEHLPGLSLSQDEKNSINNRLLIALRRAYVTVEAGPSGKVDVRSISNERIAKKYQQVSALLTGGITNAQDMSLITASLSEYELPERIDVEYNKKYVADSGKFGDVDLSNIPKEEIPFVWEGLTIVASTSFPGSTIQYKNAYWPVTFIVRRGGKVVGVRYELIFDNERNVRVERLGEAKERDMVPDFADLSLDEKKTRLMEEYGFTAVVGRPAHGERPERAWSDDDLNQMKAALDMLPPGEKTAVKGFALVRDHEGVDKDSGQRLAGVVHSGESADLDEPGKPPYDPPHIHYFDLAFEGNIGGAVGPPGAAGPGGDQTIFHEFGHARIQQAFLAFEQASEAANLQAQNVPPEIQSVMLYTKKQQKAWQAWKDANAAASQAMLDYNAALISKPPASREKQAELLAAAKAAIEVRNQARLALGKAGFPKAKRQRLLEGTAKFDAATDAQLAAQEQLAAAQDQIPTFVALAKRFGFHKFTDYARTAPDDGEWFAETYSLFITDPHRLNQMNHKMFLWFQAGMPMDRSWQPTAP